MPKKVLNVVATAYRATLEEQDDTIVWLTHALRGAGAPVDLLLRGNATNYAVQGQDASGLAFGERRQTRPPQLAQDLATLAAKGARVYLIEEDLAERGIARTELIAGVEPVGRATLPALFAAYDQIWHW